MTTASTRMYSRHRRYRPFPKHSDQALAWLEREADRLETTPPEVFAKLRKYTAEQVELAANLAALP